MQLIKNIFFFALLAVCVAACKKEFEGDKADFGAPETYLVVDSIYRSGDNRYTTTVEVHWWGTTKSGFIKGYEVSVDGMKTWAYTTSQDSVFLLTINNGSDTADVEIFVRAINNAGIKDPTPASTAYPIKNTAPSIAFDYNFGRKTKAFPAFRFNWLVSDIDGLQDISAIEVYLNDSNAGILRLPASVTASTFVGDKTGNVLNGDFSVFNNTQTTPFNEKLKGGIYDSLNYIYIRAIDRSGSKSVWVKDSIQIKTPKSGLLFINQYQTSGEITNFYKSMFDSLGASYTSYDIISSIYEELPSDEFTTKKTFEFFNRIVWVSEDPLRTLALAQKGTESFFNQNGRILFVLEIPNDVPLNADVFSFTPIQSLVPNNNGVFRMQTDSSVISYDESWPKLKATKIITYPRPFFTYTQSTGVFSYDTMATAQLSSVKSGLLEAWGGPNNVMSKRINVKTNKTDMVVLTVPLHSLNGNANAASFFKKVVLEELGF
jgi:hypothetical protein